MTEQLVQYGSVLRQSQSRVHLETSSRNVHQFPFSVVVAGPQLTFIFRFYCLHSFLCCLNCLQLAWIFTKTVTLFVEREELCMVFFWFLFFVLRCRDVDTVK